MSSYDNLVLKVRNIKNALVSQKATFTIHIKTFLNETYDIDGAKYSFRRNFDNGFYVVKDKKQFMRFTWDRGSYQVVILDVNETLSATDIQKLMSMIHKVTSDVGAKKQKTSEKSGVISYSELYSNIESLLTEITKLEEVNSCVEKIKLELYGLIN